MLFIFKYKQWFSYLQELHPTWGEDLFNSNTTPFQLCPRCGGTVHILLLVAEHRAMLSSFSVAQMAHIFAFVFFLEGLTLNIHWSSDPLKLPAWRIHWPTPGFANGLEMGTEPCVLNTWTSEKITSSPSSFWGEVYLSFPFDRGEIEPQKK